MRSLLGITIIFIAICWIVNLIKFTNCDFKSDYRCEAIHGVGLIPYISSVTVWFDVDKKGN